MNSLADPVKPFLALFALLICEYPAVREPKCYHPIPPPPTPTNQTEPATRLSVKIVDRLLKIIGAFLSQLSDEKLVIMRYSVLYRLTNMNKNTPSLSP